MIFSSIACFGPGTRQGCSTEIFHSCQHVIARYGLAGEALWVVNPTSLLKIIITNFYFRITVRYNNIMKSQWYELKEIVREQRQQGVSISVIEKKYGIPRSTLSGWFKDIVLSEEQRTKLMQNSRDGWEKARISAASWHNTQKLKRLEIAELQAKNTLDKIHLTPEVLDVALAMLYLGEGAKSGTTSIANSNPAVLRFVLSILYLNYKVKPETIRCDLHLRSDQSGEKLKNYWSKELRLPLENFKYIAYDKRSVGKPSYGHYKGVCVITCHQIAIQRKLIALYNQLCERVSQFSVGS